MKGGYLLFLFNITYNAKIFLNYPCFIPPNYNEVSVFRLPYNNIYIIIKLLGL